MYLPQIAAQESLLALVRGVDGTQPLPTVFNANSSRSGDDERYGSLGISLRMPNGAAARVVPRLSTDAQQLTVYFETDTQRQVLGRLSAATIERALLPRDLVLWAGDLDQDGKVDLISRLSPTQTDISGLYLWLSGRASDGQLVGPASESDRWAVAYHEGAGC